MKKPEQLHEVTGHVLNGLRADEKLKNQIVHKAVSSANQVSGGLRRKPLIVLCALSAMMIAAFIFLSSGRMNQPAGTTEIRTITAGERRNESPIQLQAVIDETVKQYESEKTRSPESTDSSEPDTDDTGSGSGPD